MSEFVSSLSTLYSGNQFIICIDDYNNIYSFGENDNGKCGHDEKITLINPPKQINNLNNIQLISCGANHTLCCDYKGNVFSFGNNYYGQLGLNKIKEDLYYSSIPQQINLPQIKYLSCGINFSICLSSDGELWSFGDNYFGQLGLGNKINAIKPVKINLLSNIDYIQCGGNYCYCKTTLNQYYSWGQNNYGQLSKGNNHHSKIPEKCNTFPSNIISIRGGLYHVLFLSSEGFVYSCGFNFYGQLGHGNNRNLLKPKKISPLPLIKKISCGSNHSLCIDIDNNLWVFGHNEVGQLGLGHINNINVPVKHELLKNIIDVSYGETSTFVKTLDNKIYVFGNNSSQFILKNNINLIKQPIQIFKKKEDIWKTNIYSSRAKSARK